MRTLHQAQDRARDAKMLANHQAMRTGTPILTSDEEDLVLLSDRINELERYLFSKDDRIKELDAANFEVRRLAEALAMENDTLRKALKKFTD